MTAAAEPLAVTTMIPGELPDSVPTVVYIARSTEGSILYVGMTGSLATRFIAHQKSGIWWADADSIEVEVWPDRASAITREANLIKEYDPPHNHVEKRRRGWIDERTRREEVLIEMYGQGVHLDQIAAALNVSKAICTGMVTALRKEGRLGRRPKPPARRWVRSAEGAFVAQPR